MAIVSRNVATSTMTSLPAALSLSLLNVGLMSVVIPERPLSTPALAVPPSRNATEEVARMSRRKVIGRSICVAFASLDQRIRKKDPLIRYPLDALAISSRRGSCVSDVLASFGSSGL